MNTRPPWWLVGWKWESGMPSLVTDQDTPMSLCMMNGLDTAKSDIRRMGPDDANVGLGFRITLSGHQDSERTYRKEQSDILASRFNSTMLTLDEP